VTLPGGAGLGIILHPELWSYRLPSRTIHLYLLSSIHDHDLLLKKLILRVRS
jgi:hypothetical protein